MPDVDEHVAHIRSGLLGRASKSWGKQKDTFGFQVNCPDLIHHNVFDRFQPRDINLLEF